MKRFTITAASVLVLALAACSSNQSTNAAPGAVSGKSSCADKAACCKENKAATCDAAAKAKCDAAAPAAAAAVSPGAVKSGSGACPLSGKAAGCPLTKTNG